MATQSNTPPGRTMPIAHQRPVRMRRSRQADGALVDADATRLARRLARHRDHLFTFLHKPDVPADNNHAERQIRPAVIIRKNSQSNRSDDGAATQAILMSIYRTLRLRGLDANKTIANALRTSLTTGHLPPLPGTPIADG